VTRYLLDTNVVSELRKTKPHGGVTAWIEGLQDHQLYLSVVTIGELQRGIERTRKLDEQKVGEISKWVDRLEKSQNVLSMDSSCFREWARLMEGKSEHLLEDAMIAATARVHGLTVASRNEKNFQTLGVPMMNPFHTKA
jgi:predicted nucleic acid-binding protein